MNNKKLAKGLWPVMLTPFDEYNRIDIYALRSLVEFYLESGSDGLFANCLSSEMFQLSEDERLLIVKTTTEACKNKIPVVATGTFYNDVIKNSEFIKKIYDLGVASVIINTSILINYNETETELKDKVENILIQTKDIPLGAYECPQPYKRLLSPELMNWMASTGRFLYFKDTSCDNTEIKKKLEAIRNSNFSLYNANIPTAIDSLKDGAAGLSPIGANFFPKIYSWIIKNYDNNEKIKEVESVNAILSVIDPFLHNFYPYSAKLFLHTQGFKITTNTRIPAVNFTKQDLIKLKDLSVVFKNLTEIAGC
jgi:4-hydroxy-tetrahydrodipicolinate synthase